MTKEIRMTNDEVALSFVVAASSATIIGHSSFELCHSFVIGYFVIRHRSVIRHSRKEAV
jgi:hypothetical protein